MISTMLSGTAGTSLPESRRPPALAREPPIRRGHPAVAPQTRKSRRQQAGHPWTQEKDPPPRQPRQAQTPSACGVPLVAHADYPVRGAAAAAAARAPGMVSRWARLETAQRGTVRVKVLWCISGESRGSRFIRPAQRDRLSADVSETGYQRRAASVNAALIAERMAGAAVASLRGCDGFSASTVTA